jgi:hypothetical protein
VTQVSYSMAGGCARVGHNGGPPLDLSWTAWNWRRAHAAAWKTPGREIADLRLRRANALGLSYRDYTSVILDRGVRLSGVAIMLRGALAGCEAAVQRKLATLDCLVMICAAPEARSLAYRSAAVPETADSASLVSALRALAAQANVAPSALFVVGTTAEERQASERAGFGLFVEARSYFTLPL